MLERLVYIAGYGRSGSTLLDVALNDHPDVFGAGELTWLFEHRLKGVACSCGESVSECSFWSDVLSKALPNATHADIADAAAITLRTEKFLAGNQQRRQYLSLWRRVHQAIREVSGKAVIVDSSKSNRIGFRRLPLLVAESTSGCLPVHLVRDPRAVMWSLGRGTNRRLESGDRRRATGGMARGLASWAFSNLAVEWLQQRTASRFHRLRYEDLTRDPQETLNALGEYLQIDLSSVAAGLLDGRRFAPGHGIAGNRMRRSGKIVLRRDEEWVDRLPFHAQVYSQMVWPLMRSYKYPKQSRDAA